MITKTIEKAYSAGKTYIEGRCLSSDSKPTTGIANGSLLLEMDTATMYMFDEAGQTWRAWS